MQHWICIVGHILLAIWLLFILLSRVVEDNDDLLPEVLQLVQCIVKLHKGNLE